MEKLFQNLAQDKVALQKMLEGVKLLESGENFEFEELAGGVSSVILKVRMQAGQFCVKQALPKLKVAKDWRAPVDRVFAEINYLSLADKIVPGNVPKVVGVDRALGAFVMEFLPGDKFLNWKSELLSGRPHISVGTEIGTLLGKIHSSTATNPEVPLKFKNDENFYALRLEPYLVETANRHPDLKEQLLGLVSTIQQNSLALVHGDVSPKNILIGGSKPILLDAECCYFGDPSFDLAFLLNHFLLKAVKIPELKKSCSELFLETVAAHSKFVTWEPLDSFDQRVARLLPGLFLARIDGKSPVEYLNEEERRYVCGIARQWLLEPFCNLMTLHHSFFGP